MKPTTIEANAAGGYFATSRGGDVGPAVRGTVFKVSP